MFEAALNIAAELDRRVDRVRQLARPRGQPQPVGRAAGRVRAPTRRSAGWRCRWRPTSSGGAGRRARPARPGRPIPALADARRPSAPRTTCSTTKLGAWAGRHRPRQGRRPAGRRRGPGGAGVRRPRCVASTRSSSPAATTRTVDHPVVGVQPHPVAAVPVRPASTAGSARPAPMLGQHNARDPHRRSASPTTRSPPSKPTASSARCPAGTVTTTMTTHAAMTTDLFDRIAVIDVDTHLTEPPDDVDRTHAGGDARRGAAHRAHRRQRRLDGRRRAPRRPRLLLDGRVRRRHAGVDPEDVRRDRPTRCTTPTARLAFLDEQGIDAQVLYPNVGGFGNGYFLRLGDRELVAAVRAGVQRLPHRLVQRRARPAASPITALPFWDVDLAIAELQRCIEQRPPRGELLQPAAGLRPAAARAPALGPDLGGGAGGRHVGELPRRRRLDGHAVRRRRPAWAG